MPNLFHFATSELSQDAVLCWLLSWANVEHQQVKPALHHVSQEFIKYLITQAGLSLDTPIQTVRLERQYKNIDILCYINETTVLVIEDKTNTQESKGQLERYKKIADEDFVSHQRGFIFLKTGNQGDYKAVIEAEYALILRSDLLRIFETPIANTAELESDIFGNFRSHLLELENATQSYKIQLVKEWNWTAWQGFYLELQEQLQTGNWDYVPNPSGGFMGYWADFVETPECEVYWQIEAVPTGSIKLCFKIALSKGVDVSIRDIWHQKILVIAAEQGLHLTKPSRFGSGAYMTVAVLNEFPTRDEAGLVNLEATLKVLRQARSVILAATGENLLPPA
jgi:hypothetical protein